MPTYTHYSRTSESQPKVIEVKKIVQTSRELVTLLDKSDSIVSLVKTSDIISFDAAQLVVRGMNGNGAYTFGIENLTEITTSKGITESYTLLVNPTPQEIEDRFQEVLDYLSKNIFKGDIASVSTGGTCTPNQVFDDTDTEVFTLDEGDTVKAMTSNISIAKVGTQVQMTSAAVSVTAYPQVISHRPPSYTTGNAGDYPTLFAAGYFDLFFPDFPIDMVQLGADNFTLAANNRFGNTSRYTSTDGTPSDAGTAVFSSYGAGVPNIVRDNLTGIMWYNVPFGDNLTTWDSAQPIVDAQNTAMLGGFNDWIRPTRNMYTISAIPDNDANLRDSPNLIIDVGTRRYCTCEKITFTNLAYIMFHNGDEILQSPTTTAAAQTRVVLARIMTLTELFG